MNKKSSQSQSQGQSQNQPQEEQSIGQIKDQSQNKNTNEDTRPPIIQQIVTQQTLPHHAHQALMNSKQAKVSIVPLQKPLVIGLITSTWMPSII